MKTSLIILAISLTFATTSFAEDNLTFTLKTHETLILKKITKNRFEKISDSATGTATLDLTLAGRTKNIMAKKVNESDNVSSLSFEVTGKNILRIEDDKERIDKEIQAEIKKSILGKVKSINIDSKTMEALYAASIQRSGLGFLKNLRALSGATRSTVTVGDMNCKAEDDLLICEQDANLLMAIGK